MPPVPDGVAGDVPDFVLLPTQRSRCAGDSPERRLAIAVLALAIADLQGRGAVSYGNAKGAATREKWRARMGKEAAAWISRDEPGVAFSFASLCAALDVDVAAARKALAGRRAA